LSKDVLFKTLSPFFILIALWPLYFLFEAIAAIQRKRR